MSEDKTLNDKLSLIINPEKIDRIVTDLNFLHKLTQWGNDFYDANEGATTNLMKIACFEEIIWDLHGSLLYFQNGGDEARFVTFQNGEITGAWRVIWDDVDNMQIYSSTDNAKVPTGLMESFTVTFTMMNHYVREYRDEAGAITERTRREAKTKKPKHKTGKKRVTYLTRREITVKYIEKAEKRQWTRQAGSWGVKGHPRTYHRGQANEFTIWIDKYTKGQGEYQPKLYVPRKDKKPE